MDLPRIVQPPAWATARCRPRWHTQSPLHCDDRLRCVLSLKEERTKEPETEAEGAVLEGSMRQLELAEREGVGARGAPWSFWWQRPTSRLGGGDPALPPKLRALRAVASPLHMHTTVSDILVPSYAEAEDEEDSAAGMQWRGERSKPGSTPAGFAPRGCCQRGGHFGAVQIITSSLFRVTCFPQQCV